MTYAESDNAGNLKRFVIFNSCGFFKETAYVAAGFLCQGFKCSSIKPAF